MKDKKIIQKDEFRKNKVGRRHKCWTYEKDGHDLKSFEITHTAEYYNVKNEPLSKNPNPNDKRPAYFIKEPLIQNEKLYGRKYKDYSLPKKDKDKMRKYRK